MTQLTGHLPDSQDQRNTVRTRVRYEAGSRLWVARGKRLRRVGFALQLSGNLIKKRSSNTVHRSSIVSISIVDVSSLLLSLNASLGADVYKRENFTVRLQADGQNLNNRLNLIDFGGLFSGNAVAPPRSYFLRLVTSFRDPRFLQSEIRLTSSLTITLYNGAAGAGRQHPVPLPGTDGGQSSE